MMGEHPSNSGRFHDPGFEPYNGNLGADIKAAVSASAPTKTKKSTPKAAGKQKAAAGVSPQSCTGVPDDVVAEAWTLRRLWRRANGAHCMGLGCKETIVEGVHTSNTAWLRELHPSPSV